MSGGNDDDDSEHVAPTFEEQIKFLRNAKKSSSTQFQKTTEYNVKRKLQRESTEMDEVSVDSRLDAALNRETGSDIFGIDSIANALIGKKASSAAEPDEATMIVGK